MSKDTKVSVLLNDIFRAIHPVSVDQINFSYFSTDPELDFIISLLNINQRLIFSR